MNLRPFLLTCVLAGIHSTQAADTLKHSIPPSPTSLQTGAALGYSVAMSSTYLVTGAPADDVGGQDSGRVRVFDPATGTQLFEITNPSPATGDQFGTTVATVGSLVIVSAPYDDTDGTNSGQVYVFNLSSPTPTVPAGTIATPVVDGAQKRFGWSLAVSGSRLVVGTYDAGSVFVYNLSGPTPTVPVVTLASPMVPSHGQFGYAVAIQGTRVAAGAPFGSGGSSAVYLYDIAGATPTVPVLTFDNPAPQSLDRFGWSLALTATSLVVGTPYDNAVDIEAGTVYAYDLSSATPTTPIATLNAPAGAVSRRSFHFGASVAVSGGKVIVGQPDGSNPLASGHVYVFDLLGGTPTVPLHFIDNPTPTSYDNFGHQVAIVGDKLAVGAPWEDSLTAGAGAVHLYDLAGGTPTTPTNTLMQAGQSGGDAFGAGVAVSGNLMAVRASQARTLSIYDLAGATPAVPLFTVTDTSIPSYISEVRTALAMSGSLVIVPAGGSGLVQAFNLSSGTPTVPFATLSNPDPSTTFGRSLAISGTLAVIGDYDHDGGGLRAGQVLAFDLAGSSPSTPILTLNNPSPGDVDQFGTSVAISGSKIVVGTPYDDTGATNAGSVYVYNMAGASPTTPALTLQASTRKSNAKFGARVGISGNLVVASEDDPSESHSKVYVFDLSGATPSVPVLVLGDVSLGRPVASGGLAISGTRVVVGPYVYDLSRATPGVPVLTLSSPAYDSGDDGFASAVAIDGTTIVAGAPGCDEAAADKGWVYVFGPPTTVTIPPALTAPNSFTTHTSTLTVNFSLPEPALPGSVKLVFWNNTPATHVLTLAASQESMGMRSFTFSPANPTASPVFASTTEPLPDGHYSVGLSYQDVDGSAAASSGVKTSVLIDVTAPTIGAPAEGFSPTILVTPAVAPNYASQAVAYDAIGLSSVTQIPAPGAALPAGVTNVVITAVDTVGHSASTNASITVLSFTQDTDGDGLNDASEFQMAALGFNWQVAQPALVNTLMSNASGAGLYTTSQVQALNVGTPLITKNPTTGLFKLTIGVEKSTNLQTFTPFPMTEPQTFINGAGKLDFYFTAPDNAAFFQIRAE